MCFFSERALAMAFAMSALALALGLYKLSEAKAAKDPIPKSSSKKYFI
jgi:hypothetical protein